jgi:2-polyprenyl-3-methyl-5-hydroxy-6-metoxy-1,4-benzoquinol methylase
VAARASDSILDVGCGEGVFTERLASIAREVIGIDPSAIAIERASRRVPGAAFLCTTVEDFDPRRRFDIVAAVEMLYYVESVEATLEKLRKLGRTVILAYTNRDRARLDPHFDRYGNTCLRSIVRFGRSRHGGFTIAVLKGESG